MMIKITYGLTIILALSQSSMMLTWLILELNLLSFILLMNMTMQNKIEKSGMNLTYFIVQTLGSATLLVFMVTESTAMWASLALMVSMIMKGGFFPLQSWVYKLSKNISPSLLGVLLSIQKMPIYTIMFSMANKMSIVVMWANMFYGLKALMSSKNMKNFLISSSIYTLLWMMIYASFYYTMFLMFMLVYFIMIKSLMQESTSNKVSRVNKMLMEKTFMFFSAGLPPYILFYAKFYVLEYVNSITGETTTLALILATFTGVIAYYNYFSKTISNSFKDLEKKKESAMISKEKKMIMISLMAAVTMV